MTTITVRGIDDSTFKEFKAQAVRNKLTLGQALTLSMRKTISGVKKTKFTMLKPVDWGKGSEQISKQVDEILYGK